jgi:glutathione S-transferase
MKLYTFKLAPSPRRVRIFLAEKGIEVPMEEVNLREREQLCQEYKQINDRCDVPFLVLDDGTGIGEVEAICRYFEETHPEPPVMGRDAREKALVSMWNHRFEQEGFFAIAEALRNANPRFEDRALIGPRDYKQIPELAERGKLRAERFFDDLDRQLTGREYVCGDAFTMADITAMVCVDFAKVIELQPGQRHANLLRWRAEVSARPSAAA